MHLHTAQIKFAVWLAQTRGISPHSMRAYSGDISAFRQTVGPDFNVRQLSREQILSFVEDQRAGGMSNSSIRRRMSTLRLFCRWLAAEELVHDDPWSELSLKLPISRTLPRAVPANELGRLLVALTDLAGLADDRPRAERGAFQVDSLTTLLAVALMIGTGIRVSEAAAIKCDDLDVRGRRILIEGKGQRERTVYLPDSWLAELCETYLQVRVSLQIDHATLLFNRTGAPLTAAAIRARVKHAGRLAGLSRHVTPHMFRHSAATELLESGVDIRYVQRLLGHASITTTQIYTHVSDAALRRNVMEADVLARCRNVDN